MVFRTLSILFFVVVTCITTRAQEPPQFPEPEKEHQWLQKFVGEWSAKSTADLGPGVPPLACDSSISSRMIGGFWVLNEMKGDTAGTPMHGLQTIGFDRGRKKYVGTWVDSMSDYIWRYEGTVDETGRILTLEAEGPNMMAEGRLTKFQDIYEFKSADEIAMKSTMLGDDGKWITFMTGTARRQKQAP